MKEQGLSTGEELRQRSIIIDGCVYEVDCLPGYSADFPKSGVTAINLTIPKASDGFRGTMCGIAQVLQTIREEDRFVLAKVPEDIEQAKADGKVAIIMAFQEPQGIEDKLEVLGIFHESGVRTVQLTYNWRGYIGDGCLEPVDAGLSAFGRRVVKELNNLGMLVDLSHCSSKTLLQACEVSEYPVACTHANPKALANNPRNKTDAELRAVADTGGIIGISPWGPICWDGSERHPTLDDYVRLLEYTIDLVGIDHVGFGSDCPTNIAICPTAHLEHMASSFSGIVGDWNRVMGPGWDVRYCEGFRGFSMIGNLIAKLVEKGCAAADIQKIIGGNFLRVFRAVWK